MCWAPSSIPQSHRLVSIALAISHLSTSHSSPPRCPVTSLQISNPSQRNNTKKGTFYGSSALPGPHCPPVHCSAERLRLVATLSLPTNSVVRSNSACCSATALLQLLSAPLAPPALSHSLESRLWTRRPQSSLPQLKPCIHSLPRAPLTAQHNLALSVCLPACACRSGQRVCLPPPLCVHRHLQACAQRGRGQVAVRLPVAQDTAAGEY